MNCLKDIFSSDIFTEIYSKESLGSQQKRYSGIHKKYIELFGLAEYTVFSSPGRTEISGNHTDHNLGKVIAASISLDTVCFASPANDNCVDLYDLQYQEHIHVDLSSLEKIPSESHSINSLIRGVAAGLDRFGLKFGGFRGCLHSQVFSGSGLSSSAALEVLLVRIFSEFHNSGKIDFLTAAQIGQFAENSFFGKPCGLMDQTACASGGVIYIDFRVPEKPEVRKICNPLNENGYCLAVVSPGGDHAGLTSHYSSIPEEMKKAASVIGSKVCRGISLEQLFKNSLKIRKKYGDRVFLRAFHFLNENQRVDNQAEALEAGHIDKFLELVNLSGSSSWKYLQNVCIAEFPRQQPLAVALAAADNFTAEFGGACRIHGGGFAGTILVFLRFEKRNEFSKLMKRIFGKNCVTYLEIREHGPCIVG